MLGSSTEANCLIFASVLPEQLLNACTRIRGEPLCGFHDTYNYMGHHQCTYQNIPAVLIVLCSLSSTDPPINHLCLVMQLSPLSPLFAESCCALNGMVLLSCSIVHVGRQHTALLCGTRLQRTMSRVSLQSESCRHILHSSRP